MGAVFSSLSDFFTGPPCSLVAISKIEQEESISLPGDYKNLLLKYGPGEGFIGEQYFILWDASEITRFNKEYELKKYAPGFLMIGSNGGGEGFAYDLRDQGKPLVMLPFIGMSVESAVEVGKNISELFAKMKDGHAPFL